MEIRTAAKEDDLLRILELGGEFGHLMLYQKDPELMEKYLPRILVAEEQGEYGDQGQYAVPEKEVVGYYHYIISGDPGFEEMLRCYRQFPEWIIDQTRGYKDSRLCVCMQGASHRDVFREFIKYLQSIYPNIWCFCSLKSGRPETYKELGFDFDPFEEHTFWNVHKGGESTYRLGRWSK